MSTTSNSTIPTVADGVQASEGTLYVSKPFRSKTSKRMRALITFTPRKSHFDTTNELSGTNEFRGFFTLFWISLFIFTIRTYLISLHTHGYFLSLSFLDLISRDALSLALSDFALIASTGICVPFMQAIAGGWLRYYWTGVLIQSIWQISVLAIAITWTFNRHWPWVQSGFLTLHTLVLIMKMHSYMAVNGALAHTTVQAQTVLQELRSIAADVGGNWETSVENARKVYQKEEERKTEESQVYSDGVNTPLISTGIRPDGTTHSYVDADTANVLRKRLLNVSDSNALTVPKTTSIEVSAPSTPPSGATSRTEITADGAKSRDWSSQPLPEGTGSQTLSPLHANALTLEEREAEILCSHPDERIKGRAVQWAEMVSDCISPTGNVRYPNNLTLKNFAVYMLIPTLVYELEYPRTDRIRPLYVFEKVTAFFGSFALLYTVTETFIIPLSADASMRRAHAQAMEVRLAAEGATGLAACAAWIEGAKGFGWSLLDLALPFMVAYLLLFYVIFECICNGFAELSYFADRQFYNDWWNSTSWDEFSRKWNKPVYTFLLRHVYAPPISAYGFSRRSAMAVTFLISAVAHELVMVIVTKKIRMYLFGLQLIQIPLIAVSRMPAIRRNKTLGNIVFWLGLYAGFPLLCVAYVAY